MIHAQNEQVSFEIVASAATNATQTLIVDRRDADYVKFLVCLGTAAATNAPTALIVAEGDSTTAFDNIPALAGGTGFTVAGRGTTNPVSYALFVNGLGRKRYLRLSLTTGSAAAATIVATKTRLDEIPSTAAGMGHVQAVIA
jgi:hypothetical protein